MNQDNKNALIGMVLILVVLFGWNLCDLQSTHIKPPRLNSQEELMKSAVTISLVREAAGGPFVFWHEIGRAHV